MYTIKLFTKGFSDLTALNKVNFWDFSYENEIGKGGKAEFKIKVKDNKATTANLKLFNRVKIYKGSTFKWIGYIERLDIDLNVITVKCSGMLNIFKKRNTAYGTTPGATLTTEFFRVLNTLNGADDTGIKEGTSDSVHVIAGQMKLLDIKSLSALKKIADTDNRLMYIDENEFLNIVKSLGTDKSSSVIFRYIIDQVNTANIKMFDITVDGGDMWNVVTGKAESLGTVKTDPTSITEFGRLETRENFGGTTNANDLDDETQSFLDTHKNEMIIPDISPNSKKIDIDSFDIGDTVKVILDNNFIALNQNQLIIKKKVTITNSGEEDVSVSLAPEGSSILPSNFFNEIDKLKKNQESIEGVLFQ